MIVTSTNNKTDYSENTNSQFLKIRYIILFNCLLIGVFGCTKKAKELQYQSNLTGNDSAFREIIVDGDPIYEVFFEKKATFSETDKILLRFVGNFDVDEKGRVYIAEKNRILVFDKHQNFLKQLGRKGRGPGEFENMGLLTPKVSINKLYVYDDVLQRINVFDLINLEFQYTIPLTPSNWDEIPALKQTTFKQFYPFNDSLLLVGFRKPIPRDQEDLPFMRYYLMNAKGDIVSKELLKMKDNGFYSGKGLSGPTLPDSPVSLPHTRSSLIDVNQGNMYSVWTETYSINITNITGVKKVITKPMKNSILNKDQVLETMQSNHRSRLSDDEFPETWPAINYFFVDDESRIWVSTIFDDANYFRWDVLNNDGKLLATFKWPGQRLQRHKQEHEIRMVKNNFLYTLEKNPKSGSKKVVKYKIKFTER